MCMCVCVCLCVSGERVGVGRWGWVFGRALWDAPLHPTPPMVWGLPQEGKIWLDNQSNPVPIWLSVPKQF